MVPQKTCRSQGKLPLNLPNSMPENRLCGFDLYGSSCHGPNIVLFFDTAVIQNRNARSYFYIVWIWLLFFYIGRCVQFVKVFEFGTVANLFEVAESCVIKQHGDRLANKWVADLWIYWFLNTSGISVSISETSYFKRYICRHVPGYFCSVQNIQCIYRIFFP